MSVVTQGMQKVEDVALVILNEWLDGDQSVDSEDFCRDFTRAIATDVLREAAIWMCNSGPTIAAILLDEWARELEIAARNS